MNESYRQLVERFHTLEAEHRWFDVTIKGHPFWQYMRYYVFEAINREKSGVIFPKRQVAYANKIRELVRYLLFRVQCIFQKQRRFDLLLFTHNKTALIDGKQVDFHMYPLAKAFGSAWKMMIAHRYEFPMCKSHYPCPVLVTRPMYLFSRLRSYFVRYTADDLAFFHRLGAAINTTFHTQIDMVALVKYIYSWHLICYKEYLRFFKIYRPSAIMFCDSGDTKPLIEAAHDVGIRAIDYQHGIISPVSLLYRYPENIAAGKIQGTNVDAIFTFGDYWNAFLKTPSRAVSVGFPYFDRCSQEAGVTSRDERSILITSVLSARNTLAQLAIDLADLLPDYTIYYKLRPDEYDSWEGAYPETLRRKTNLTIVNGNDGTLYDYFAKCRYLISTNSMTLYEGMASGLTTFVLKAGWYEEMKELYERKFAFLVSSAREIVDSIGNQAMPVTPPPEDYFFRKNALAHLKLSLAQLLPIMEARVE